MNYLLLEIKRTMRAGRFMIFTLAFPILMFVFLASVYGDQQAVRAGLMINMTAWGAMSAALFTGSRVAVERDAGWQRQLRLTPLTGAGYLAAKGVVGMMVALPAAVLVPLVGAFGEGVTLDPGQWLQVTAGLWLAAIPFALLGLMVGQLGTADSTQAITSVLMMVLALFGGLWVRLDGLPSFFASIARVLPSYWMSQIGQSATGSAESLLTCVLVLAAWTAAFGVVIARRYRVEAVR
jgi:ABC-2 type transport system permease protein